ncbi:MoxR-like ATPase [Halovivax ruber XH-70]|uniref:MoxR-like ATPase n=1 Tax=Halovivax ruber (strain DSM 18193 / JCM 13892 / XH-70) TaxID=797302 RepID=L0ICM9_HALRX|nr:AAA family ATPase [Halovivax ruber]AGB17290.1 MoxR-like ATPase [Halovivax ruber XH-70]
MTGIDSTGLEEEEPTHGPGSIDALPVDDAASLCAAVERNVAEVIVGNEGVIRSVVTTMLARGHILIEDVPGVGKTMLTRAIARSIDCEFSRVQFTPDLLPSDITGVNVFNQQTRDFEFQPGPVFGNVVLADEINRAPPKAQSALLEAMEESQVTVDGETRPLPTPFTVIATQNAVEPNQTYELPLAELDRFMTKLSLGYPDPEEETALLDRAAAHHPIEELEPVADRRDVLRARETVAETTVREPIREYAARLAAYTRDHAEIGVSPRGTIALVRAAMAHAVAEGRGYVTPEDVQAVAPETLAHRIATGAGGHRDTPGAELVADALSTVPVE